MAKFAVEMLNNMFIQHEGVVCTDEDTVFITLIYCNKTPLLC